LRLEIIQDSKKRVISNVLCPPTSFEKIIPWKWETSVRKIQ